MIRTANTPIAGIDIDAIIAGDARLSLDDAHLLYRHASMHDLGRWSTAMADRILDDAGTGRAIGLRSIVR